MLMIAIWGLLAAITPSSGAALCHALTPADFSQLGIPVSKTYAANIQDNGTSAYCVYRGKSGAMGGVELDIFFPTADPAQTEANALGDSTGKTMNAHLLNVDDSRLGVNMVSGGPAFAMVAVRKGNLVYVISIPSGVRSASQLLTLSRTVLQRVKP